jgi:hypothetical protein
MHSSSSLSLICCCYSNNSSSLLCRSRRESAARDRRRRPSQEKTFFNFFGADRKRGGLFQGFCKLFKKSIFDSSAAAAFKTDSQFGRLIADGLLLYHTLSSVSLSDSLSLLLSVAQSQS